MNYDFFLPLASFALVSSITPGPNNLMLMASGANFGFRRTAPHMLGISIGFCLMVFLIGVGLAQAFTRLPALKTALTIVAVAYLLWLAYKIATAAPVKTGETSGQPFTFLQAAAFQWVNPKAWTMALNAVTLYAPSDTVASMGLVALIFGIINLPSVSIWTIAGQEMRRFLTKPARLRAFNWFMATLLVASLAMVLK